MYVDLDLRTFLFPSSETFAQDFFLTYPAFMSITELCEQLRQGYHGSPGVGGEATSEEEEQDKLRKRR